jgi:hypothetical protein
VTLQPRPGYPKLLSPGIAPAVQRRISIAAACTHGRCRRRECLRDEPSQSDWAASVAAVRFGMGYGRGLTRASAGRRRQRRCKSGCGRWRRRGCVTGKGFIRWVPWNVGLGLVSTGRERGWGVGGGEGAGGTLLMSVGILYGASAACRYAGCVSSRVREARRRPGCGFGACWMRVTRPAQTHIFLCGCAADAPDTQQKQRR